MKYKFVQCIFVFVDKYYLYLYFDSYLFAAQEAGCSRWITLQLYSTVIFVHTFSLYLYLYFDSYFVDAAWHAGWSRWITLQLLRVIFVFVAGNKELLTEQAATSGGEWWEASSHSRKTRRQIPHLWWYSFLCKWSSYVST